MRLAEITVEINTAMNERNRAKIRELNAEKVKILQDNADDISAARRNQDELENSRNTQDWGQNSDHFMFVIGEGDQTQVVCYDKLSILELVSDRPKWLLECTGPWARSAERVRDLRSLRLIAALNLGNSQDESRLQLNKIFGKEMATRIIQHEHDIAAINCLGNKVELVSLHHVAAVEAADMRAGDYNIELADLDKKYEILEPGALNTVPGFSGDKVLNSFGEEMYAGIVVNPDGFKLFVDVRELKSLLILLGWGVKIFYLTPKLDASLSHTIRYSNAHPIWDGAPEDEPDFVSTQHCQHGSAIVVNQISICVGDNCSLTSAVADDINKTFVPEEEEEEKRKRKMNPPSGTTRKKKEEPAASLQPGDIVYYTGESMLARGWRPNEECTVLILISRRLVLVEAVDPPSAAYNGDATVDRSDISLVPLPPPEPRVLDFGSSPIDNATVGETPSPRARIPEPEASALRAADLPAAHTSVGEYTPSVNPPDWAINEAVENAFSETEDHTSEWATAIARRIVDSVFLVGGLWEEGEAIVANMSRRRWGDYQFSLDEFSRFDDIRETATEAADAAEQNVRNGHFTDLIAWEIVMNSAVEEANNIILTLREYSNDVESGSELAEEES